MAVTKLPSVDTGPLSKNTMRDRINDLIDDAFEVEIASSPPGSPEDGDLWVDEESAAMYVYILASDSWVQISGSVSNIVSAGNWTSGWTAIVDPSSVAKRELSFNHTLDTTDLTISIYVSDNSSGTYAKKIDAIDSYWDGGSYYYGAQVTNVTNTQITVQLGNNGYRYHKNSGEGYASSSWTGRYIKVVASSGGSGGGGGGGASVSTGTAAPSISTEGDLWFNENVGSLFVYIEGTGWIETSPGGGGGNGSISGDWQEVTRVIDGATTYTNDSGGLIFGNVHSGQSGNDALGIEIEITVDDVTTKMMMAYNTNSSGGNGVAGQYMVPVNATYKFHRAGRDLYGGQLNVIQFHEMQLKGGGGGGGPRAYVAFNGDAANLTDSIYGSYNVTSITDNNTGNYTVNLSSTLTNGVVTANAYAAGGGPGIGAAPALDGTNIYDSGSFNQVKVEAANVNWYQDYKNVSVIVL